MVKFAVTSIVAVIVLSGTVLARPAHFRRSIPEYEALEAREDGNLINNYVRAYDDSNELNARSPDGDEEAPEAAPGRRMRHVRYGLAFSRYGHHQHEEQSQPSRRELADPLETRDILELYVREPHFPVHGATEVAHHVVHHALKHSGDININLGGDNYRRELADSFDARDYYPDLYEREPSLFSLGKSVVSHAVSHEAHHHHHHIDLPSNQNQNQNDRREYDEQADLLGRDFEEFEDLIY